MKNSATLMYVSYGRKVSRIVTNLENGATDDISGTGNSLGVEVFDTEVTAVELGRRQGMHGLDFTALSKETFDLSDNWCSLELFEVRVSVVVDSDDELSFEVANVTWVVTLICSNSSWGHGEDTSVRNQLGSNVPCLLRITNVREGDGEEATTNNLSSIDGLERREVLELARVSVRDIEVVSGKGTLKASAMRRERKSAGTPMTAKARTAFSSVLKTPSVKCTSLMYLPLAFIMKSM